MTVSVENTEKKGCDQILVDFRQEVILRLPFSVARDKNSISCKFGYFAKNH